MSHNIVNTSTDKIVPFFNYPSVFTSLEEELLAVIADAGRRGAFILQRDLQEFESALADFVGAKHVVGVANATDGLLMILRASGIGPGDEVLFCTHTMVATAAAIYFSGATPVPIECGPDHMIDPAAVEGAISARTKAIMPTQLNGRTCDMDALQAIADLHGLAIVEDAAQALGSRFKGRAAGTFGLGGAISFYPAKTLGCLGDGGCVITNDDAIYEKLILYRDHGRNDDGDIVLWAMNSRLDNIQAAILNHKLGAYNEMIDRRRAIADMYHASLGDIGEVRLPPGPNDDIDHFDIYQNYEIEADHRDDLKVFLSNHGVGTMIQWGGKAVHQFTKLGFTQHLQFTDELFKRLLMLPMHTSLADQDVEYVCKHIREFYGA